MSCLVVNRGGAFIGLKPELTVAAPAGSTIDLLQNGIVVATYTLKASETEHTFAVKIGTYTVRGTLGSKTDSVDAVIDTVGQYAVKLEYVLWLYHEGDECEEVTGGWEFTNGGGGSLTKNSDHMILSHDYYTSSVQTVKKSIRNPKYGTFCAEVKAEATGGSFNQKNFVTLYASLSGLYSEIASTEYYAQTIDVSSMIGSVFYVQFYGQYWGASRSGKIYIKNAWLE